MALRYRWATTQNFSDTDQLNASFFGNQLGQSFQTENGKLAIYPSGVAGTTSLLIEARDAQTNLPAASRTLDVTIDALP